VRVTNYSFTERFYLLYKVGRFAFSAGLLVLLFSLSSLGSSIVDSFSLAVLAVYSLVSLLLFALSKKPHFYEFLLDELFLFLLVVKGAFSYAFFSIFLLFPVFFSVIFLGAPYSYLTLLFAFTLQFFYFIVLYGGLSYEGVIQLFLNALALLFMLLAAQKLRVRFEAQELYIRSLEVEREEAQLYKRLYEISADLAHELKNPLASIRGAVELLKEGKNSPKLVDIIYRETKRLDSIIKDFLNLARPSTGEVARLSLKSTLEGLISSVGHMGKEVSVKGEEVFVESDPKLLSSALDNLLRNALQWARRRVEITVLKEDGWAVIHFDDDGPGVPPSERNRVFEPFYSRRSEGSGLGLSIVKKFAIDSGGYVSVGDSPLGGARFTLKLPLRRSGEGSDSRG
jgi:signal transduction histidine kinase